MESLHNEKELQEVPSKQLVELLRVIRTCNKATDLDEAINNLVNSTCNILECERASVFLVDPVTDELVIEAAVGLDALRIPMHEGIAGYTVSCGSMVNIPDAYEDPRFSRASDEKVGFRTRSILCIPIRDGTGEIIGVLEALNKIENNGVFKNADETLITHLADQVGVIIRNQLQQDAVLRSHDQVLAMLDIVKAMNSNLGIASLMFTITERSPGLVDADRATLYLVDRHRGELWSLQGAIEIRVPVNKGLVGHCAMTGDAVNIADAHKDERFDAAIDLKTGYTTRSVLAVPITDTAAAPHVEAPSTISASQTSRNTSTDPNIASASGSVPISAAPSVIGVLEVINKKHGQKFTPEDAECLRLFLDIAGPMLRNSHLFQPALAQQSEFGAASDIVSAPIISESPPSLTRVQRKSSSRLLQSETIPESEQENEEDTDEGA